MKEENTNNLNITNNYSKWMGDISNEVRLSRISIPGTHDSATYGIPDGTIDGVWARTQEETFVQQFEQGVRFFDIRGKTINDNRIALVHSNIPIGTQLGNFMEAAEQLLKANPRETIIMSLKEDYKNEHGVKSFGDIFFDAYYSQNDIFYKGSSTNPTLGEVRGKVVVFRRYNDTNRTPKGGFAPKTWVDDATFETTDHNQSYLKYFIQDQYSSSDPKASRIETHMEKTAKDLSEDHLYINFTNISSGGTAFNSAYARAKYINPLLGNYIVRTNLSRVGWVIIDYATAGWPPKLATKVIEVNNKL